MHLEWEFWHNISVGFHTPDHSLPLFLPGTGYVTPINAAHQIVALSNTILLSGVQYKMQYQVQVMFKGEIYFLQIIDRTIIFFGYDRFAYSQLEPWPRNIRNLKNSIVSAINLLSIANVNLS